MNMFKVMLDVREEIERQKRLAAEGRFPWAMSDPAAPAEHRVCVLTEEIGEVAEAVLRGLPGLYDELIQVAASAIAWATVHQTPEALLCPNASDFRRTMASEPAAEEEAPF